MSDSIEINGVEYIRADSVPAQGEGDWTLVRSRGAGVFVGQLESHDAATQTAVLTNARRIWYWEGAASLSELAQRGTSKPGSCKFPAPVSRVTIGEVVELIPVTSAALATIESVKVWSK